MFIINLLTMLHKHYVSIFLRAIVGQEHEKSIFSQFEIVKITSLSCDYVTQVHTFHGPSPFFRLIVSQAALFPSDASASPRATTWRA